jgi:hypothetical protein
MGFVDLAGNEFDREVDSNPPRPRRVFRGKTTGLEDTREEESLLYSPNTSALPTDNEESKYLFFSCLAHYLKGNRISEANFAAVELCVFVEVGAAVCGMDPMKKGKKEQAYFNKYMRILDEIEDKQFVDESVCNAMHRRSKMAKKDNTGQSLWQKYKSELMEIWNFAKMIPRVGSLLELPSGSNQLKHMKMPLFQALWMEKHPAIKVGDALK